MAVLELATSFGYLLTLHSQRNRLTSAPRYPFALTVTALSSTNKQDESRVVRTAPFQAHVSSSVIAAELAVSGPDGDNGRC